MTISQKEIIQKYPEFFRNYPHGAFECGKGWNTIIDNLCSRVRDYYSKFPEFEQTFKGFDCIKEKFGLLRVGTLERPSDLVFTFLMEAENESLFTCVYCGSTEAETKTVWGWLKTLCPSCRTQESNNAEKPNHW
jgi:hypothetical protein